MTILFPSSYLNKRKPDEEYEREYTAAVDNGFDVVLFDQEKWDRERIISINEALISEDIFIYRGWMMKPEDYVLFSNQLNNFGIALLVTPSEYKNLHVFKNSYPYVVEDAPKTLFYSTVDDIDLKYINNTVGRFMIKDFVKSVKGTDFPKCFDHPDKEYFDAQMEKFIHYRGDLFTGGIQVKEYLDLKEYGSATNEYRVFYLDRQVLSITRNSGQPVDTNRPFDELIQKYSRLQSSFYTVDYAECADGSFKVIETGDGGVSGLPDSLSPDLFYKEVREVMQARNKDVEFER